VPLHIRNAPTRLMKDLGYHKGYKYPHSFKGAVVEQDYLPDRLKGKIYYEPTDRGYDKEIAERLKAKRNKK
jgi:putative ATPase